MVSPELQEVVSETGPSSGWDAELQEVISETGCTEDQAREKVTLRYLHVGDCRPLLDWARRRHIHSTKIMRVVAAMLDPKYRRGDATDIRYKFSIEATRKRGGAGNIGSWRAKWLRQHATALSEGSDPGQAFWYSLACAIVQGNPNWIWARHRASFLVTAKVQAIKSTRGRRRDPELSTRDKALAQFVQRWIDADGYESAITRVVAEINAGINQTGQSGCLDRITYRTVRNAYDHHAGKIHRGR